MTDCVRLRANIEFASTLGRQQAISESMKRLTPIRLHVALGLLVTLVGIAVLTMATMNPSRLLAWFPAIGGMSVVTAACFALAGSALWIPLGDARQPGYRKVIGILLCLISSLVLLNFLGVIAEPISATVFLWPGRGSLATAMSLLMVGLTLILLDSCGKTRMLDLLQFGLATMATIAFMAILGHALSVDLFVSWLPEVTLMSLPTALTLLLLAFGLFGKMAGSAAFRTFYAGREDLKIFTLSILLLYCTLLIASMVGTGLVAMQTRQAMLSVLQAGIRENSSTLDSALKEVIGQVAHVGLQSDFASALALADPAARRAEVRRRLGQMRAALADKVSVGSVGMRVADSAGKPLGSLGNVATEWPRIPLALPYKAQLSVHDGLWLDLAIDIARDKHSLGTLMLQLHLNQVEMDLSRLEDPGKTGELLICARSSPEVADCFSSHMKQIAMPLAASKDGSLTPIALAFDRKVGVAMVADRRNSSVDVLAAYAPVGSSGLGMVKMLDASEFYQPLRERLLATLFSLVVLALLAILLLFNRVYPIVRKLDFTKSQLTETLDNLPESVITINTQGIVQNASANTKALFGYTPIELIGRNIDLLMPESVRSRHSGYFSGDPSLEAGRDRVIGAGPREMKAIHRDGSEFPIEIAVSQFIFQGGRLFIAIVRDLRERKKAEESLGKWKQMFALAEWGIAVTEPNGTILEEMNPAFAAMHGYTIAELTGTRFLDLFAPEVRDGIPAHIALANVHGHHRFESLRLHKEGHIFPALIDITIARTASGEFLYRIANVQDLSELKLTDDALRQSESLLNLVLNSLPVGVFVADKEGKIVRVNPAGERIWKGMRFVGPEAYGQYIAWWADSGKPVAADEWALAKTIRSGEGIADEVLEIQCFDGSHKIILNSAVPLRSPQGELQGAIVVNEDITDRRRAQEEMRISREFFQSAFDAAAIGMAICDIAGRYLNVNRAQREIVGYCEQELLSMSYQDITYPDDLENNVSLLDGLMAGKATSFRTEKRYVRKDGRVVWVLLVVSLISDEHGRPLYSIGQMIDIDRQKRIEDDLRANRESLANAQRLARIGDWQWSLAENTAYWSEETFRIFGLQAGSTEASPGAFFASVHPDDHSRVKNALNTAIAQHKLFSIDHRIRLPDGTERMVHSQGEVLYGPQANPLRVLGTVQDISERKQIELALLNSREQLRAMSAYQESLLEGERKHIAREVHDELGQLLTALKMDISLLRLRFGSDPELQQKAEEMRVLVEKTINVVRYVASNLRPAALDHGIVPAIEWLAEDFSHRWEMPCEVSLQGEDIFLDDVHATVIFRVVQESLTNVARHAQAAWVIITLRRGDHGLSLTVQDNGRGFDPAVIRKRQSFGLLGMRERVLALGGTLRIDSVAGKGTTVVIELPFHDNENP